MEIVDTLIPLLQNVAPYPECMPGITPRLTGRAFFPGGRGRSGENVPELPLRPVMIIGQDFGTLEYWNAVGNGNEPADGTWGAMIRVLQAASLDPACCFFTNAIMGVRRDQPMTGAHPALDDRAFVDRCKIFLVSQISVVQPSAVVALGIIPTILAASQLSLADLRMPSWAKRGRNSKWRDVDDAGLQFIESIPMPRGQASHFAFASVVHPANRQPNLQHRAWKALGLAGAAADDEIWRRIAAVFRSANT
jgi:hypothetical protein